MADLVSTTVISFPGLGSLGQTAADNGVTSTARVHGVGTGAGRGCSESTLQDDVVAVITLCCKRNTGRGRVSQEDRVQWNLGVPEGVKACIKTGTKPCL